MYTSVHIYVHIIYIHMYRSIYHINPYNIYNSILYMHHHVSIYPIASHFLHSSLKLRQVTTARASCFRRHSKTCEHGKRWCVGNGENTGCRMIIAKTSTVPWEFLGCPSSLNRFRGDLCGDKKLQACQVGSHIEFAMTRKQPSRRTK